jgi:hypothetical protein
LEFEYFAISQFPLPVIYFFLLKHDIEHLFFVFVSCTIKFMYLFDLVTALCPTVFILVIFIPVLLNELYLSQFVAYGTSTKDSYSFLSELLSFILILALHSYFD